MTKKKSSRLPAKKEITLKPEAKKGFDFTELKGGSGKRWKNSNWSKMLARVFKIDVLKCDCSGGKLRPICVNTESDAIRLYLKSVEIDYEPPPLGPPRYSQENFDFAQEDYSRDESGDSPGDKGPGRGRLKICRKEVVASWKQGSGPYTAFAKNMWEGEQFIRCLVLSSNSRPKSLPGCKRRG